MKPSKKVKKRSPPPPKVINNGERKLVVEGGARKVGGKQESMAFRKTRKKAPRNEAVGDHAATESRLRVRIPCW